MPQLNGFVEWDAKVTGTAIATSKETLFKAASEYRMERLLDLVLDENSDPEAIAEELIYAFLWIRYPDFNFNGLHEVLSVGFTPTVASTAGRAWDQLRYWATEWEEGRLEVYE